MMSCSSQTWVRDSKGLWTTCCTPPTHWCQQQHWSCQMNLISRTRATPSQGCLMRHGPRITLLFWQNFSTSRLEFSGLGLALFASNALHLLTLKDQKALSELRCKCLRLNNRPRWHSLPELTHVPAMVNGGAMPCSTLCCSESWGVNVEQWTLCTVV